MEQLRFIVISVTLLLCTANAFAQRHYENISALEINSVSYTHLTLPTIA